MLGRGVTVGPLVVGPPSVLHHDSHIVRREEEETGVDVSIDQGRIDRIGRDRSPIGRRDFVCLAQFPSSVSLFRLLFLFFGVILTSHSTNLHLGIGPVVIQWCENLKL